MLTTEDVVYWSGAGLCFRRAEMEERRRKEEEERRKAEEERKKIMEQEEADRKLAEKLEQERMALK